MRKPLLVGFLLCAPIAAFADGNHVDAYVVPSSELEVDVPGQGSDSVDGDGFGVRGFGLVSPNVGLTGEYQSVGLDRGVDVDQLRLGAGLLTGTGLGLFAEYVKLDGDDGDADGFAVHGRYEAAPNGGALNLYGQIGYVMITDDFEDNTGFEFSLGAAYRFAPQLSGFVDYRQTSVEGEDSEIELDLSDWRIGARFHF